MANKEGKKILGMSDIHISFLVMLIQIIALFCVIAQLYQTNNLSKKNELINYYSNHINDYQPLLNELSRKHEPGFLSKPMPDEFYAEIEKDSALQQRVEVYLTFQETIATAVNNDVFHEKMYNDLLGGRTVDTWIFFESYICKLREKEKYPKMYDQFEKLAKSIAKMRNIDLNKCKCNCRCR